MADSKSEALLKPVHTDETRNVVFRLTFLFRITFESPGKWIFEWKLVIEKDLGEFAAF